MDQSSSAARLDRVGATLLFMWVITFGSSLFFGAASYNERKRANALEEQLHEANTERWQLRHLLEQKTIKPEKNQ